MAGHRRFHRRGAALLIATLLGTLIATGPRAGAESSEPRLPEIESLTPSRARADRTHSVVIRGRGFGPNPVVRFERHELPYEVVSRREIVATVPPGPPGASQIRVVTPAGTSTNGPTSRFVRVQPPVIDEAVPAQLPLDGGTIQILGAGLATTTSVIVAGSDVPFEVRSGRRVTAIVSSGLPGPVAVAVHTSDELVARSAYGEVARVDAPVISVITPGTGPTAGGVLVAIRGFGLAGVTDVRFDGVAAEIESVEMTEVVVRPPAHATGAADVEVTGPGGTSEVTDATTYAYGDLDVLRATTVDAGPYSTCALLVGGNVACWGGVLRMPPTLVPGLDDVDQVSTGQSHTCARVGGSIWCWGQNSFGELGDGTTEDSPSPVQVGGITNAIDLDAGLWTTCAVLAGGSVECWGNFSPSFELSDALDVSVGTRRVCVLREGSLVQCVVKWGPGFDFTVAGAVSVNDTDDSPGTADRVCVTTQAGGSACRSTDGTIEQLPGVHAIEAGARLVCSLDGEGQVTCADLSWDGSELTSPSAVPEIDDAIDLAVGDRHGCAVLAGGQVRCWGDGNQGQIGDGTTDTATDAASIPGMVATDVSSSIGAAPCAIVGGEVYCWGQVENFHRGVPSPFDEPIWIEGLAGARALAVGEVHVCGLMDAGRVRCGGYNAYGVVGNGTEVEPPPPWNPEDVLPPEFVPGLRNIDQLAAGGLHTCAARVDGAVFCWGLTQVGSDPWQLSPRRIAGVDAPGTMAAGFSKQTCAVVSTTVTCWGSSSAPDPVTVSGLTDPVDVAAGDSHECAIVEDGGVWCWGSNSEGQLGNGTTDSSAQPVEVTGIDDATDIALGYDSTCVAREDGTVWCWGQLSDGTTADKLVPVQLAGLADVERIVGGPYVTALMSDGAVATWSGSTSAGLGHLTGHRIPVTVRAPVAAS